MQQPCWAWRLIPNGIDAVRQHQKIYGGGDDGNEADDRSMGSAAAMQALKMFSGGGSGNSQVGPPRYLYPLLLSLRN